MLVVTSSDDNYVAGVIVLVASVAFHTPGARFVVLDLGISEANRARIDARPGRLGITLSRIAVQPDLFDQLTPRRSHLSRGTYLRLLIPRLLPDEARALYMDCDMVALDDLSDLDRVPLGEALLAAAPCPSPDPHEMEVTGRSFGSYVNGGLLLMNLDAWRRERFAEACFAYLADPDRRSRGEDQAAINALGGDRIVLLPGRYNVYATPDSYPRQDSLPERPAVLHYVVKDKPWIMPLPLSAPWDWHAARVADLLPPRRLTLRRRLSLWNRWRKRQLGLLFGREKYLAQKRRTDWLRARVADAYMARLPR